MKKLIFGIAAAAVLAAGTVFVVAQRSGRHKGMGHGHRGFGIALKGLDLTDEQKVKMKEIMDNGRTTVQPLMEQARVNREKIKGLGTDGSFDQAQVEALATEQGGLTAKMIVEKERAKSQVFAILTDEQKANALEMRSKFEERTKGRRPFRTGHSEEF